MIIMKKNKEQFLLIILSILMVIILSTNLYSFIIERKHVNIKYNFNYIIANAYNLYNNYIKL